IDDGTPDSEREAVVKGVLRTEADLVHRADLVLACSHDEVSKFMRLYGVSAEKCRIVPNGSFIPPERSQEPHTGRPVALFIGSNWPPNTEACEFIVAELAPNVPDVDFVIVGSVGDALNKRRVHPNVTIAGEITDDEKIAWLGKADIGLNPVQTGAGTNVK